MRGRKKAFTIVELVVVIAIIAILAAVLIPTFSGMLKKANASADEQTVSLMNVAIAQRRIEGELSGEADLREAIDGVYGAGFLRRVLNQRIPFRTHRRKHYILRGAYARTIQNDLCSAQSVAFAIDIAARFIDFDAQPPQSA